MKYLLDTNVISELSRAKPHGAVLAWYGSLPKSTCALPSIALYELQIGIEKTRRNHAEKARSLTSAMDRLEREVTVLPLDGPAARETAHLIHGKSLDLLEDAMIAAIARVHNLTVATRNTRDFVLFDVPLVDPFLFR